MDKITQVFTLSPPSRGSWRETTAEREMIQRTALHR